MIIVEEAINGDRTQLSWGGWCEGSVSVTEASQMWFEGKRAQGTCPLCHGVKLRSSAHCLKESRGAPRPRLTECCIILWRADRRRAWGVSLGGPRGQLGAGSWHMGWQRQPRMLRSLTMVSGMWTVKANSWAQSDSRHRLNMAIAMA